MRRDWLVFVNGELWQADSADGSPLVPGEHVRVEEVGPDLRLVVAAAATQTAEELA